MTEEATYPDAGFLFVLSPEDMTEFFPEWPGGISLVIWREPEQDSYYLLPEENLIDDIGRIGGDRNIPVFPAIGNMRSVRISFSEETDIVNRVSRREDLLNNATAMRARLDGAEGDLQAEREEDGESAAADSADARPADPGNGPAEDTGKTAADSGTPASGLPAWLVSSLNPGVRLELDVSAGGRAMALRVPDHLVRGDADYALALDQTSGRVLLAPVAAFPSGLDSIALTRRDLPGMIEYRAEVPPGRALRLPRRERGTLLVPLTACQDGVVLADLSHVIRDLEYRSLRKGSLLSLGTALVLTLLVVGYIGSSVVTSANDLGREIAERPSFQSPEYMEHMLGRWFSD